MNRRTRRQSAGFTLIEALVAGMILAMSSVALSLGVRTGIRSLALGKDFQRAAELMDRTLTKIDTVGPGRVLVEGPIEGVFDPPHDRFAWSASIEPLSEGHLYDVTVRIYWEQVGGKLRSVEAQTLLNDARAEGESGPGWDDL